MGLELAKAFVLIRGDYSKLDGDMAESTNRIRKGMRAIGTAAAAAGGAIAGLGILSGRAALDAAAEFEVFNTMLTTNMQGNKKMADDLMQSLADWSNFTGFTVPDVTKEALGYVQMGDAAEDVIRQLKILGDASGGTTAKFENMNRIWRKIRAQGKLTQESMNMLSEGMIIQEKQIAEALGMTEQKFKDLKTSGKISADMVFQAFEKTTQAGQLNYKAAEAMSTTYDGLKSTLDGLRWSFLAAIGKPMQDAAKGLMSAIIPIVAGITSFAQKNAKLVSTVLMLITGFGALVAAGGALVVAFTFINPAMLAMGALAGVVMGAVGALAAGIGWLTMKLYENEEIMNLLGEIWQNFVDTAIGIWDALKAVFMSFMPILTTVWNYAVEQIKMFLDWASLMTTDWSLTWELMKTTMAEWLLKATDAAWQFIQDVKIGFTALGVGMVEGIIAAFWQIVHIMEISGRAIMGVFKGVVNWVGKLFYELAQLAVNIFSTIWDVIKAAWNGDDIGEAFKEGFTKAMEDIDIPNAKDFSKPFTDELKKISTESQDVGKAFSDGMSNSIMAQEENRSRPFDETIKELENQRRGIKQSMNEARDAKRAQDEKDKNAETGEGDGTTTAFGDGKKGKGGGSDKEFDFGDRLGFAALGDKMQDFLLKGGKDEQAETNSHLMEMKKLSREQLAEQQKSNKKGALS